MDNDEIRRTIVRPWRKPARLATSKAPVERVALAVERSLHQTLTAADGSGGCPGLHEIVESLQQFSRDFQSLPLFFDSQEVQAEARQRLFARLQSVREEHDFHKHTCLAADVALATCVAIGHRRAQYRDAEAIATEIAQGFCHRIVEHYLYAQLRPILRRKLGLSYDDACGWEHQVLDEMSPFVNTTAARLLKDDTGSKVRRPLRRGAVKSTTAVLMGANLL